MDRRTIFPGRALPALLVLPQLALTAVFFLWPAGRAIWSSLQREDAFGTASEFAGLENFGALFGDPLYGAAVVRTLGFCAAVTALSMGLGLLFACFADAEIRGRSFYRTMLVWPTRSRPPCRPCCGS